MGDQADDGPLPVRLHSECLTGDVFGSIRCDCREQLQATMQYIARVKKGLVIYLRQEGRGIGLRIKYALMRYRIKGWTPSKRTCTGLSRRWAEYEIAAAILRDQGVSAVLLLTNNPRKVAGLEACQIRVVECIPHQVAPRAENREYLQTKAASSAICSYSELACGPGRRPDRTQWRGEASVRWIE